MVPSLRTSGLFPLLVVLLAGAAGAADQDGADQSDADEQVELDRRCEAARAVKLAPIRADIYTECLEKKRGDEPYCRRYADGYNGNRIGGAARFYDLPECEAAFAFRHRPRS